ncbi:hypothetical protein INR49_021914 [Caranx melampygus]|nr:hypothetical protein INR49_021914 [Caranx melampygus]
MTAAAPRQYMEPNPWNCSRPEETQQEVKSPHCLRKNAPPTVLMVSLNFLSVYLWSSDVFPTFMSPRRTTLTSGFFIFDTSGIMMQDFCPALVEESPRRP